MRKCFPSNDYQYTYFRRFHHSVLLQFYRCSRSMLFRAIVPTLSRSSTGIAALLLPRVRIKPDPFSYTFKGRLFSLSACFYKKNKKSLWLQLSEGQNMDGNIEEILAPLRLAVKEQVCPTGVRGLLSICIFVLHCYLFISYFAS